SKALPRLSRKVSTRRKPKTSRQSSKPPAPRSNSSKFVFRDIFRDGPRAILFPLPECDGSGRHPAWKGRAEVAEQAVIPARPLSAGMRSARQHNVRKGTCSKNRRLIVDSLNSCLRDASNERKRVHGYHVQRAPQGAQVL